MSLVRPVSKALQFVWTAFVAAVARLDKSFSPSDTLLRIQQHTFTLSDYIYITFNVSLFTFWLYLMQSPGFPAKLLIPFLYITALAIPFTSQFFVPATPVFGWLITYYSSRFIPDSWRPNVSVVLLPTLESVLYGANISDILTRYTHPFLDILAWIPYGVGHFIIPFVVAAFLWLFRPKQALHQWARIFGWLNLTGVIIQILLPCAPPWYEVIYGLAPATYAVRGSAAGLARIDALFHGNGYTVAFGGAPVVFGAFPSLHSACATLEGLFLSHFFPQVTKFVWIYVLVLYWATMYLTHHYLIDVVGGSSLAVACFYLLLPDEVKGPFATSLPPNLGGSSMRSKYQLYDLEEPRTRSRSSANGNIMRAADYDLDDLSERESDEEEVDITFRSPVVPDAPRSAVPLIKPNTGSGAGAGAKIAASRSVGSGAPGREGHRHTASIASLIRADERAEDGWSPIASSFSGLPPTPTKAERDAQV
ncbi:Aureobasidin resistance protein Aur1 [Steccherinum ochraceum]|uniref:Aureobasidin resistance protein Aur1 n=1 Tax=Steccherinum ochraceum TaxID=92696 RepID=A0A4R0S237_9APHY|nr:Aureobasidin resistance protein Aur1 [Steccherinum ochraceum]